MIRKTRASTDHKRPVTSRLVAQDRERSVKTVHDVMASDARSDNIADLPKYHLRSTTDVPVDAQKILLVSLPFHGQLNPKFIAKTLGHCERSGKLPACRYTRLKQSCIIRCSGSIALATQHLDR